MEAFIPIAVLALLGITLCGGIYFVTTLLGPKNPLPAKLSPYECGVKPEGNARTPFKSRFYLVAVLFLLFDVEAAFFFPWALIYRESLQDGGTLLFAISVYLAFLGLGFVYVIRKKCLEMA